MSPDNGPTPASDAVEVRELQPHQWDGLGPNPIRVGVTLYLCELGKLLPVTVKNALYRALGAEIGRRTVIAPHVQIDPLFPGKITIGEGSVIGWGTKLLTHEAYAEEWHVGPLEIGDDVTLGHSSSTRPGVTIGDGATVAAHSFVDRDVDPGERVGGTPIETL